MYKILVINDDKEIIKTFTFVKKVNPLLVPIPASFVEISTESIKKIDEVNNFNDYQITQTQEKSILEDFHDVLKMNNLHPNELWKNLNIDEINLLTEILNENYTNDNIYNPQTSKI